MSPLTKWLSQSCPYHFSPEPPEGSSVSLFRGELLVRALPCGLTCHRTTALQQAQIWSFFILCQEACSVSSGSEPTGLSLGLAPAAPTPEIAFLSLPPECPPALLEIMTQWFLPTIHSPHVRNRIRIPHPPAPSPPLQPCLLHSILSISRPFFKSC